MSEAEFRAAHRGHDLREFELEAITVTIGRILPEEERLRFLGCFTCQPDGDFVGNTNVYRLTSGGSGGR